jgi:GNAT superfamily N-acetyltransferase
MKLEYLADRQEFIPLLGAWYYQQWGHKEETRTLESETSKLQHYLNRNSLPLILLATNQDQLLGAAQLKYHEMSIYPEKEHWLGGVYVSEGHRGKKIARLIINKLISIAEDLGIPTLYLQTENLSGGLYAQLGWKPIEVVNYHKVDVLVMERPI